MTATDRARFYAGDYPRKRRMRLRYICHHRDRVSVIRTTYPLMPWQIIIPDIDPGDRDKPRFVSFDEAIHEAQRLAHVRAMRTIVDGAQ